MNRLALALLLTLAACGGPVTAPQPELPPIPRSVATQLGPVPVVFVDSLVNGEGKQVVGGFHTIKRVIYLRRDLLENPRIAWAVYYHEVAHIVMYDSGLANMIPPEVQQAIADAFAIQRVAEMLLTQARR